jgi:putative tricarboxylic transport membrane protein
MLTKDRIGALLMLAFSIAYGLLSYRIPLLPFQEAAAFTARTGPKALAVLGIVLSLMLLVKPGGEAPDTEGFTWGRGAILCGLMLFYAATVRPLGFIPATTLFLLGGFLTLGERRWGVLLGASVPVVVAFWALMDMGLDVTVRPFPAFLMN